MYPSGWPTCRPAPEGYGNMSITKNAGCAGSAFRPSPSVSRPTGLAAKNVPRFAHSSCQRSSISRASSAVYRNGTSSDVVVAVASGASCEVTHRVYRGRLPARVR